MINKVGLNTAEDKRKHFVQTAASAAGGSVIGIGCAYLTQALGGRVELKDEFKTAKQAVKDAKKQNLGEEAIKGAKNTLKELRSKVNKDALGFTKEMLVPVAAAFAVITALYGLVYPAVNEYLNGKEANKSANPEK